jgi:hypothetical protein
MVYSVLMALVLLTFAVIWRGDLRSRAVAFGLFAATAAFLLVHVVGDMTTPLTLSF